MRPALFFIGDNMDRPLFMDSVLDSNLPKTYDEAVEKLKDTIQRSSLVPKLNPIVQHAFIMHDENKKFFHHLIVEYSAFSNQALHMLLDARIRNHDWDGLKAEIDHNIDEEKGEKTENIPHLEIMRQGYKKELNVETDNQHISLTTQYFLERMTKIFRSDDNAFAAGALLAFEGSAIPEFYILDEIVRWHLAPEGARFPAETSGLTKYYVDGHKYFEIGHEEGLRNAIKPYINESNMENFVKGYLSVVLAMHNWWNQLFHDFEFAEISKLNSVELFDVSTAIKN